MVNLKSALPAMILSFIIYIVYTGSIGPYDLLTGAVVAVIVGLLAGEIVVSDPDKALDPKRLYWLIKYTIWYFLIAEVKAHANVIKRALSPRIPLNPAIIRVPYYVETDYAMITIANSITNTPGTVVVDIDYDHRVFYVHWIDAKTSDPEEARKMISLQFEEYAREIFD